MIHTNGLTGNEAAALRERFHQVILKAGYAEPAAQSILEHHFYGYLDNLPVFYEMLAKYERNAP